MTIGEKIKQLRLHQNLSQSQLAEKLCVSRAAVAKWENENGTPDIENLKALAAHFACHVDLLIDENRELELLKIQEASPNSVCFESCGDCNAGALIDENRESDLPTEQEPNPNTFCGKSCEDCTYREAQQCAGCKQGPGKLFRETCEIAKCARSKSPYGCAVCANAYYCATVKRQEVIPRARQEQLDRARVRDEASKQLVGILHRPLWVMFWLTINGSVLSIVFSDWLTDKYPVTETVSYACTILISLIIGVLLLRMSSAESGFRHAGICKLVYMLASVAVLLLEQWSVPNWLLLASSVAAIVAELCCVYCEFLAYVNILSCFDEELAKKWSKVCIFHILSWVGLVIGMLLSTVFQLLGLLLLLISAICVLIAAVKELLYRYLTAKTISRYA